VQEYQLVEKYFHKNKKSFLKKMKKEEEVSLISSIDGEKLTSYKKKEFKMINHLISWKYELISDNDDKRLELFQCDDCIKLELSF